MKDKKRISILIVVLILVVGAISYLESMKAGSGAGGPTIDANASSTVHSANYAINKLQYPAAKELVSPDGYINTGGVSTTLASLIGKKVILLDFWTYSCINCQRTIPYLNAWYQKYKDSGLVIIGVHTPEFDFEKNYNNVSAAVKQFGIQYPVVMDSNYLTWNAYGNEYWPEEYLIDIDGLVRENNIGEGNYQQTETTIQKLLAERNQALGSTSTIPTGFVSATQADNANSPETYFDWQRNQYLGNGSQGVAGEQTFTRPSTINPNTLYLVGNWNIEDQFAENGEADDRIIYKYNAQNVYFVASSLPGVTLTVLRDGIPVTTERGADVSASSTVTIQAPRLYKLIQESQAGTHTLELIIHGPKLDAYTFTF